MQKRIPAAETLKLQITEAEKMELLVTRMCGGGSQNQHFIRNVCYKFEKFATAEQRVSFIKLYDMGWELTKVVCNVEAGKIALGVCADDTAAWVGPDGKLERAAIGRKTAYLDKNWKSV